MNDDWQPGWVWHLQAFDPRTDKLKWSFPLEGLQPEDVRRRLPGKPKLVTDGMFPMSPALYKYLTANFNIPDDAKKLLLYIEALDTGHRTIIH